MFGIRIALTVVFIPIMILLVLAGLVLGLLPGVLVGLLTFAVAGEGALPWILGFIVGFPLFLLVVGVPMLFLGGLVETFKSTTWTLTYRELRALESLTVEPELIEPVDPEAGVEPLEPEGGDELSEPSEDGESVVSGDDSELAEPGEGDEPTPSVEWDSAPIA
jgi:phosphotransferase system  glucose/maltose/N-acetylglucosamine-specific IIC component